MSTETLQALSGDLAFAVGYSIAQELIELAQEAQIGTEELVVCVLSVTLLLNSTDTVGRALDGPLSVLKKVSCNCFNGAGNFKAENSAVLAFGKDFLTLAKRLSQSIALQLLSSSVRADSSSRSVRIVSLLSVTVFFVFVQRTSNFTQGR